MRALAHANEEDMSYPPRAQDVARHTGARLRQRRIELGLSQQGLADLINVTYQQIHKYEAGASRLVSERLFALAGALKWPLIVARAPRHWGCVEPRFAQVGQPCR